MAKVTRLVKSFSKLIFPVIVLIILALAGASVWLTYEASIPAKSVYIVTPEKYGQISARGSRVTEETWNNPDGTTSRGWLLRGSNSSPAVILLHRFNTDRSYMLNLGVKLNEATNFTVLMPDLRAHGQNPTVASSSFSGCEVNDLKAAIEFVNGLKSDGEIPQTNGKIGIYGLELGALIALNAAISNDKITALALDSVPANSEAVLNAAVASRFPFLSSITSKFAGLGTNLFYYQGCYDQEDACFKAQQLSNRKVLLLGGVDAPYFRESTSKISKCFQKSNEIELRTDLSPSGYNLVKASIEQSEVYDQRLIEFFRNSLF